MVGPRGPDAIRILLKNELRLTQMYEYFESTPRGKILLPNYCPGMPRQKKKHMCREIHHRSHQLVVEFPDGEPLADAKIECSYSQSNFRMQDMDFLFPTALESFTISIGAFADATPSAARKRRT
ncbi:hypothetical protein T265_12074 [Opisthorchis viverrini]|uniref:Uncharacterized protein n=1 Tax=Opisthorchis viverrini TaxID=6198 RepID=A0A074YWB1_OPIVI|nr:hypothetical protein T265_12074 [Opisthorchis viverrini]KER18973.1 hypothetical protein T265_12074 [Opisthorchis viverrini]